MPSHSEKGYHTDDPSRQRAREEADALMADPTPALQAWADKQGASLVKPADPLVWGNIDRELRRLDVLGVAKIWMLEQVATLRENRICPRKLTAKEICYRVVRQVFCSGKYAGVYKPHEGEDAEQECLPKDLRYIYNHPSLCVSDDASDPVIQALAAHYERTHKAPSQGAINRLRRCMESEKAKDTLFKEINEIMLTHRKKPLTPVETTDAPEKSKEGVAIDELFEQELAKIGDDGVE